MKKIVLLPLLLFVACTSTDSESIALDQLRIDADFVAYEEMWEPFLGNQIDTNIIGSIIERSPEFSEIFLSQVVNFRDPESNTILLENVYEYLNDSIINVLYQEKKSLFPDQYIEEQFTDPFKRLSYYFPDVPTPSVYTFISGLQYQGFIFQDKEKDGIALGLDYFLGNAFPYRSFLPMNENFSSYIVRAFNSEHLVKKGLELWINDRLGKARGRTLMDHMVHEGKKLYILDKLLPEVSDTVVIEYTGNQLEWCRENEFEMWGYFLHEDLFYSTDMRKISKLTQATPNTVGMPSVAPGRTANYIGWQIVKNYMKRNKSVSLQELIETNDSQQILNLSKYKPSK